VAEEVPAVRFTLYWGLDNAARIYSVDDLDTRLSLLARTHRRRRQPYAIDLLPADAREGGLQLGIGHPHRAFVLTLDPPGGYAIQPDVPPWPEPIAFDCGRELIEFKPEWTRVSAPAAIEAARVYVHTGGRPANLRFGPVLTRDTSPTGRVVAG
jgi:hypothetical protein